LCQYQRRFEKVNGLLQRIVNESENGTTVIVEGHRDEASLRKLGVTGRILPLKAVGKGSTDLLEGEISRNRVLILTDFDEEGKKLAAFLARELAHLRVKANYEVWRQLREVVRRDIHAVEELAGFVERLKMKIEDKRGS